LEYIGRDASGKAKKKKLLSIEGVEINSETRRSRKKDNSSNNKNPYRSNRYFLIWI